MRKVLLVGLFISSSVSAQSLTTGAISGRVTDKESEEPLAGVTVIVGSQVAITDGDGLYRITDLLPGTYDVSLELDTATAVRSGVVVGANALTTLNQALKIGEAILVHGPPPPIRVDSVAKERRTDREQPRTPPIPGGPVAAAGTLTGNPGRIRIPQGGGLGMAELEGARRAQAAVRGLGSLIPAANQGLPGLAIPEAARCRRPPCSAHVRRCR